MSNSEQPGNPAPRRRRPDDTPAPPRAGKSAPARAAVETYPVAKGVAPPPGLQQEEPLLVELVPVHDLPGHGAAASTETGRIVRLALLGGAVAACLIATFIVGLFVGDWRASRRLRPASTEVASAPNAHSAAPASDAPATPTRVEMAVPTPPKLNVPTATVAKATIREKRPEPKKDEAPAASASTTFADNILPIFKMKCINCHGGLSRKGDLDLRTLAATKKGGENGPGVEPGNLANSLVWEYVSKDKMPKGKVPKLTAQEKATVRDWILAGAK